MISKFFFPGCNLSLHPLISDFYRAKVLNFDEVQCQVFSLMFQVFCIQSKKPLRNPTLQTQAFQKCYLVGKLSDSLQLQGLRHVRLLCPSSFGVCSNSCPLSQWCYLQFHALPSSFPYAFNLSQHQSLFKGVSSSHQVAKVLELQLQLQHQSFQWMFGFISFRIGWFDLLVVQGTLKSLLQHHSSKASFCSAQASLWSNSHVHDYWKNHSLDYMDLCQQTDVSAF